MKRPLLLVALLGISAVARADDAPRRVEGLDDRRKVDILCVFTHADDDTIATPYLARAVFDHGKRAAVVHVSSTSSGFHAFGSERMRALGLVRQVEARRALGRFGIDAVWFLGGEDTHVQNVVRSLDSLEHGKTLDQLVRVVRLTRPEIVVTWLPMSTIGQNHGGHQAAGVLAVEAFDVAGDPTAFPGHIYVDGLQPWQPKKIYFLSDAFSTDFAKEQGPAYSITERSPSKGRSYLDLAIDETLEYRSQYFPEWVAPFEKGDRDEIRRILTTGDWPYFVDPLRFVRGKSLVGGKPTGDLFEGVTRNPLPFTPPAASPDAPPAPVDLGEPWLFYRRFYARHGLDHLARLVPPSLAVEPDTKLGIPIRLTNAGDQPRTFTLRLARPLPAGWAEAPGARAWALAPHAATTVRFPLIAPSHKAPELIAVVIEAVTDGKPVGSAELRIGVVADTTAP